MTSDSLSMFLRSSPWKAESPSLFAFVLPTLSSYTQTGQSGREKPAGGAGVQARCQDSSGPYQGCVYKPEARLYVSGNGMPGEVAQ